MESGSASRTALLVCAYRAQHSVGDDALCDDPWAAALAGEEGERLTEAMTAVQPQMGLWVATRTAYLDSRVRALLPSVSQVVVLGAGFDTRAARLARPHVRYFEVDAPSSAEQKRSRLEALKDYPIEAAVYVTCDFEKEDFVERLRAAGFDAGQPALVIWEGVSYYLTEPAVRATLRRISEGLHPESTLLFDHVGKKLISAASRDPMDAGTLGLLADFGEPFLWGTNDVLPILYAEGYRRVWVTSFDEACLWLTGTYDRERRFRFQWIVEAGVERER